MTHKRTSQLSVSANLCTVTSGNNRSVLITFVWYWCPGQSLIWRPPPRHGLRCSITKQQLITIERPPLLRTSRPFSICIQHRLGARAAQDATFNFVNVQASVTDSVPRSAFEVKAQYCDLSLALSSFVDFMLIVNLF